MTIANVSNPSNLTGAPVRGSDGEKLGTIDAIYFDNATNAPEWAAVKSGLFGSHVTLVPLAQAGWDGDTLTVPFDKQALQAAPHHDPDAEISAADEDELYRHYGLSAGRSASGVDARAGERRDLTGAAGVQGRDTSGPTTDTAMTRSEEQLRVGTQTHEAGRARLRKHVVTEHQQVTVPVSHEEITLQREPITDANRGDAYDGPAISEEDTATVTGAPAAADGPAPPVAVPTSDREAPRFAPRSQDDLAPSGAVTRVRANLAAVQMVRALQAEGRRATPDEQKVLARWSGWGAVPEALDERRADFAWARAELAQLLSPEELLAAARNTLNAHYTDLSLVQPIWEAVARLGFTEGPVLEPGCGWGNFIAAVHEHPAGDASTAPSSPAQ